MDPTDPPSPSGRPPERALTATPRPPAGVEALALHPAAAQIAGERPPAAARSALLAVAALVFAAVTWASIAEIDRIVVGRGKVISVEPAIIVQPLTTSVIRSIDVRVGQNVVRGQRLVALDPTFAEADVAALRARERSLAAQIARLEAEFSGQPLSRGGDDDTALQFALHERRRAEYLTKMSTYAGTIARQQAELATNQGAQRNARERLRVLEELERMRKELFDRQTGSRVTWLEAQREVAIARGDADAVTSRAREIEAGFGATSAERDSFVEGWRRQVADDLIAARRERDGVQEQLNKAERMSALNELRAPVDGQVLEIANRSVGSVAREAEPLVTLMPTGSAMEIEAIIDPQDVARLRVGDVARIKIDAFPYQRHGWIDGRLRTVTEDTLRDADAGGGPGAQKLSYKARVDFDELRLRDVPADARLIPGMTATAEIRVGSRRVITYFLYPLLRTLDEGIREP